MPPSEVREEGIPTLVAGQQLELGVGSPRPRNVDLGPPVHAAATVIGESGQRHRKLTLGHLGERVKGRVTRVPMRSGPPCRLAPLLEELLQLLGHRGRYNIVDGVRAPEESALALCKKGLDGDIAMGPGDIRDSHVRGVEAACVADASRKVPC